MGISIPRVLIVDDEPGILEILSTVLIGEGYAVDVAATGGEALTLVGQSHAYSVALIDLELPDMSGRLLGERLRNSDARLPLSPVFMSGRPRPDDLPSETRFLSKPFSLDTVRRVVRNRSRELPI